MHTVRAFGTSGNKMHLARSGEQRTVCGKVNGENLGSVLEFINLSFDPYKPNRCGNCTMYFLRLLTDH